MAKKPNVILMFVDDLGIGDVSCFNPNGKIHTENVDKLAADGMRFTDSHASSPLCAPSRYSLLTGRYNFRSKLKCSVLYGDSGALIEPDRMTIANIFKDSGYKTACVGKWHLGFEWEVHPNPKPSDYGLDEKYYNDMPDRKPFDFCPPACTEDRAEGIDIDYTKPIKYGPINYGFDYYFGTPASLDQPPYVFIENDRVTEVPTTYTGLFELQRDGIVTNTQWQLGPIAPNFNHERASDDLNNKVLDLIDEYTDNDEPFFIYYPCLVPHTPYLPKPEFRGKSGLNLYADFVLQMDSYVGSITEKLKEKGIYDDTIFIFTADNGCCLDADIPTLESLGHYPSREYKGQKLSMYEGGHRLPTIVSYPNKIKSNSVCNETVCHSDFFMTFADMLDKKIPDNAGEDSFSNLPLWYGGDGFERKATICNSSAGWLGVIKGDYKLMCCENGGASHRPRLEGEARGYATEKFELYNLAEDPSETNNIYDENHPALPELLSELVRVFDNGRSTPGAVQENYVPDVWVQVNFK